MDNPAPTAASRPDAGAQRRAPRTLAVDIGGTGIKAELLDERGRPLNERARVPTPKSATPRKVIAIIGKLARLRSGFDRVSVGFPGLVKEGVVYTAPNLGRGWNNFDLQRELRRALKRPVRVANDADVQGLGAVSGRGVELVITLGTGLGSVIFVDGHRIHLELGHHPFRKGRTYEDELGHRALKKKGKGRWNRRLREAIEDLKQAFDYDRLLIGGGNTKYIRFEPPAEVKIVSNEEGLLGGIKLWQDSERKIAAPTARPAGSPPAKPAAGAKTAATEPAKAKPARTASKSTAARKIVAPAAKPARVEAMPPAAAAKAAEVKAALAAAKRTTAARIAAAEVAAKASRAKIAASAERALATGEGPASAVGADAPAADVAAADSASGFAGAPGATSQADGESEKGGGG